MAPPPLWLALVLAAAVAAPGAASASSSASSEETLEALEALEGEGSGMHLQEAPCREEWSSGEEPFVAALWPASRPLPPPNTAPGTLGRNDTQTPPPPPDAAEDAQDAALTLDLDDLSTEHGRIFSQPPCYSESGHVQWRRCSSTGWLPRSPPLCWPPLAPSPALRPATRSAPPPAPQPNGCPPGFQPVAEADGLCLWLEEQPSAWRPACLRLGARGVLGREWEAALAEARERGAEGLWLPWRRDAPFAPLRARLPGRRWMEPLPPADRLARGVGWWDLRQRCLWVNASDGVVSSAPCSARWRHACVVDEEERLPPARACPIGFFASPHPDGVRGAPGGGPVRCFRALRGRQRSPLVNALENHECPESPRAALSAALLGYVVPRLVDRLPLNDDEPCWTNFRLSELPLNGDTSTPIPTMHTAVFRNGRAVLLPVAQRLRCTVCAAEAPAPAVAMSLRRDPQRGRLLLSVYGASGLWVEDEDDPGFRCFTNARGGYQRPVDVQRVKSLRWTSSSMDDFLSSGESGRRPNLELDVEKTLFRVKYEKDSAGHYWCEGHTVGSFKLVQSNVVLVHGKTKGNVYSLGVDIKNTCDYSSINCDPSFDENFEDIEKELKKLLPRKFISDVRFLRIVNITENRTLSVIFHIVPDFQRTNAAEDFNLTQVVIQSHLNREQRFELRSLLSTEGCVPLTDSSGRVEWEFAPLGAVSVSESLCLQEDGLPVSRSCMGDFVTGGRWGPVSGSCAQSPLSAVTTSLHEICSKKMSSQQPHSIASNVSQLTASPQELTPADVYFTAVSMRNLARSETYGNIMSKSQATSELTAVSNIVNHISLAKDGVVSLSQRKLNSSNMLLDAVDVLFDKISNLIEDLDNEDGVLLTVTPYVLIQISDVRKTNVTGLALLRQDDEASAPTDFTKYEVLQIDSSKRLETVLEYSGLEVAVWAPQNLVEYIYNSTGNGTWYDPQPLTANVSNTASENVSKVATTVKSAEQNRIVVVLFYKDLTFYNETEEVLQEISVNGTDIKNETVRSQTRVGSRIVSITIPGFSQSLPVPIPIVFRPLMEQARSRECAYWDFTYNSSTPSQSRGGWSSEGCVYAGNATLDSSGQLDVCLCTHLTHFAELLGSRYGRIYLAEDIRYEDLVILHGHNKALDVITLMGCCLSLFGITGIIVTAIAFRSWRQKPGSKILLQLSAALGFQIILLMVSGTLKTTKDNEYCRVKVEMNGTEEIRTASCGMPQERDSVCIAIGALLHYFSLAAFSWMFVSALLQFMRYVKILGPTRPPRFFLKSLFFGWGVPLVPTVLLVSIDPDCYVQPTLCYPSGLGLYVAVLIPILIFLVMNLSVFLMVINSIVRGPDGKVRSNPERKLLMSQLNLSVLLFFLLGLSWLFGLLVVSGASLIFSYLFCITATLQGFVMFVFFVACDPSTRKLWQSTFGSWSNLLLLRLGPADSNADLTSSVSTIHRESTTDTTDTM